MHYKNAITYDWVDDNVYYTLLSKCDYNFLPLAFATANNTLLEAQFLGIPLAITPPRVRHNRGFLFTIGIIFCYYIIRAFSMSLGYNHTILPFFAANLPNIILGLIGYIYYKNKSEKI